MARNLKQTRRERQIEIARKLARIRRAAHGAVPPDWNVFQQVEVFEAINRTITDAQRRVYSS